MKTFLLAAVMALPVAISGGCANAADLEPMAGFQKHFRTGASAMIYYTARSDGYHVVTPVQSDDTEAMQVFRFTAVLAPGQNTMVSVPHVLGATDDAIVVSRVGDRLTVDDAVKLADSAVTISKLITATALPL